MMIVKESLQGKIPSTTPIWLMRQAGRYLPEYQAIRKQLPSFMDLCFNEEYAIEVTLQPLKRFGLDAAILFSDILVIPHVLGQKVRFLEGQGPVLDPLDESIFFTKAKEIDVTEQLKIPLNILRNVRKELPQTKAVIGFAGSPWTIATYMLEQGKSSTFSKIKDLLEQQHPLFLNTMALLEEAIGAFLVAQINAGADVVQIFDSWARAVPLDRQEDILVNPLRRIIGRIREHHPTTPIIYYGRGVVDLSPQISKGFSSIAFGVDETVPLWIMRNLQKIGPIQGNLSPQVLVEGGKTMVDKTKELLDTFQGTPYVFNLGHGILPQTPPEHVAELVDMIRKGS